MKQLFICFIAVCLSIASYAQDKNIDSLINSIHNSQLLPDHQWVLETLYLTDSAAAELIKIGKPAAKKLVSFLDDPDKAIVVHFVLCNIYETSDPPKIKTSNIEDQVDVTWHHFHFIYFEGKPYATDQELSANKKRWELFLKNLK